MTLIKYAGSEVYAMYGSMKAFALTHARPTRLNFLFDFRRKGMKESRTFLSYFFFLFIFLFLLLLFFLFLFFLFLFVSFFARPNQKKETRRTSQPSAIKPNS